MFTSGAVASYFSRRENVKLFLLTFSSNIRRLFEASTMILLPLKPPDKQKKSTVGGLSHNEMEIHK